MEELTFEALTVIAEEAIDLLDRLEPGFTAQLFRRITRRALRAGVVELRPAISALEDIDRCRSALAWLASRTGAEPKKLRRK